MFRYCVRARRVWQSNNTPLIGKYQKIYRKAATGYTCCSQKKYQVSLKDQEIRILFWGE